MIWFNDEHSSKALFPISVTEEEIVICVKYEHRINMKLKIFLIFPVIISDKHP